MSDWIAVVGIRAINLEAASTLVPGHVMNDSSLSLTARGLYALLLTYRGQPIDPYDDAVEDDKEIRAAIEELIDGGFAVRVPR